MDIPAPQQNQQVDPQEGYRYLCEMVSAYLQTLPTPVRVPTSQAVNAASAAVGEALRERAMLLKEKQAEQAAQRDPRPQVPAA